MEPPVKEDRNEKPATSEWGVWTCPCCHTDHVGWSAINICSRCGYRDQ